MRRDYRVMREVLKVAARCHGETGCSAFAKIRDRARVDQELVRLEHDGIIDGTTVFDGDVLVECSINGLTDEGREFYRLVENDEVWDITNGVLACACVDIPYPLLKETCEEVVKRYVASFIPDITPRCKIAR